MYYISTYVAQCCFLCDTVALSYFFYLRVQPCSVLQLSSHKLQTLGKVNRKYDIGQVFACICSYFTSLYCICGYTENYSYNAYVHSMMALMNLQ